MSKLTQAALVAVVLLSGASAASARPAQGNYDNATVRSQIDLNSPAGNKAFWESVERSGR